MHRLLYNFIVDKIGDSEPLSKLEEKDVFVALSGIVNGRMDDARKVFGEEVVKNIEAQCVLKMMLTPLAEAHKAGGVERSLDVVEAQMGIEASSRLMGEATNPLKRRVLEVVRQV
ncbi:hypothetical protein BGZ58_009906 [Dissophora ornata]|nr:hypothetical protein BGZ58_009906 [Dissophora ornata]